VPNAANNNNNLVITIYTDHYDSFENVVGDGMSGKKFLDNPHPGTGMEFETMDLLLQYIDEHNVQVGRIDFHYVDEQGVQMFRKFTIHR
jgi:hypothetical protein